MPHAGRMVLLGAVLALSACVGWMPRRGSGPIIGGATGGDRDRPGGAGGPAQAAAGVGRKPVFGKREPVTLIAKDKTECVVPEARFKETAIGEEVWCDWRSP